MEIKKSSLLILSEIKQIREYIGSSNIDNTLMLESINNFEKIVLSDNTDSSSFEYEKIMLNIWSDFRHEWITKISKYTDSIYKSPIFSSIMKLPISENINYSYERSIDCNSLELKAKNYRENNENWDDEHIIFSNGMSALTTMISSYKSILRNNKEQKLKVFVWGAYFETRVFLDFEKDDRFEWRNFTYEQELFNTIINEDFDILLIEPVRYDWDLEAIDIVSLLKSVISVKSTRYRLIIFDTTLISQNIPIKQCLDVLYQIPFLTVVNFNSLLKLNQEGLELSNGGLISIYTSKAYSKDLAAKGIAEYLRKIRTILGVGLDLREISLLDNPFTFNINYVKNYSDKVFFNNEFLANAVSEGAIF